MYTFIAYLLLVCVWSAVVAGEQKTQSPRPGTPVVKRLKETETRISPRNIDKPVGDHFRKSHNGAAAQAQSSKQELSKSQPSFNPRSTKVKIPNS